MSDLEVAQRYLAGPALVAERLRRTTDERDRSMMRCLFERLAGETVGDVDRTLAAVTEGFVLATTDPGTTSVSGKDELAASVAKLAGMAGQMLLWFDFDAIVADDSSLAVFGTMHTTFASTYAVEHLGASPEAGEGTFTSDSAVSLLCRYDEGLMSREDALFIPSTEAMRHAPGHELPSLGTLSSAFGSLL